MKTLEQRIVDRAYSRFGFDLTLDQLDTIPKNLFESLMDADSSGNMAMIEDCFDKILDLFDR